VFGGLLPYASSGSKFAKSATNHWLIAPSPANIRIGRWLVDFIHTEIVDQAWK
jgi:hypothetical protein